jgi:hypothetical protein
MIQVTLTPKTPEQVAKIMRLMAELTAEVAVASTGEPVEVRVEARVEAPVEPKKSRAAKPAPTVDTPPETAPSVSATPAGAAASSSEVTLTQVRAKLSELSQAGKASQVKALLSVYGVSKLTDLGADKYAALLAEAETLA